MEISHEDKWWIEQANSYTDLDEHYRLVMRIINNNFSGNTDIINLFEKVGLYMGEIVNNLKIKIIDKVIGNVIGEVDKSIFFTELYKECKYYNKKDIFFIKLSEKNNMNLNKRETEYIISFIFDLRIFIDYLENYSIFNNNKIFYNFNRVLHKIVDTIRFINNKII